MRKLPIIAAIAAWLPFIASSQKDGVWDSVFIVVGAVFAVMCYMTASVLIELSERRLADRKQETVLVLEAFTTMSQQADKQLTIQQQVLAALEALGKNVDTVVARLDQQHEVFANLEQVTEQLRGLKEVSTTLESSHQAWINVSQQDRANLEKQTAVLMDTLVQTTESKHAVRERLVQLQESMLKKLGK
ncbi:hypothetical protein [Paenibacillus pinistramenti]|uniref:hypothetical protein n=1 Tax=Paenibacillus pinistramenti TaxID=1768003 RepID=UPI0011083126|nr:hypothetical protein [Paenibacillus pinistramenti]